MWDYRCRITDVHDGDTLTADIDLGFCVTVNVAVRLFETYAPELKEPGGTDTRDYLRGIIAAAQTTPDEWPWRITTQRVRTARREVTTFGRYVATIAPINGGLTLNDHVSDYVADNHYPKGTGANG